jgi:hypothetical protein
MTRDNCCVCGKEVHISEAFKLDVGNHGEVWICVWCIDKQLKGSSDYRIMKTLEKQEESQEKK